VQPHGNERAGWWPGSSGSARSNFHGYEAPRIRSSRAPRISSARSKSKKKAHSSDSNGATSNGKVSTETVMLTYSNRAAA
jgi:hypothetical protein